MAKKVRRSVGGRRPGAGRPPKFDKEQVATLKEMALSERASVADLAAMFKARTGVSISAGSIRRYLKREGLKTRSIALHKAKSSSSSAPASSEMQEPVEAPRYGYAEAHRPSGVGYGTSLTDREWELVSGIIERSPGPGRPPRITKRQLLDACSYVVRTGCAWRLLPKDFPPWQTVYAQFRRWTADGVFEQMHDRLREMWREREHRNPLPTASILDSQSVKSSPQGGIKGFDAGKKIKGRKRHIVTDTLGLLLAVFVTGADVQDRDGAIPVLSRAIAKASTITVVFADSAYAGKCAADIKDHLGIETSVQRRADDKSVKRWEVAEPNEQLSASTSSSVQHQPVTDEPRKGFVPLRKRWAIERTNSWTDKSRRLSKEYDRLIAVSESWVWLTHGRLLARRLAASA
jgi:transposase